MTIYFNGDSRAVGGQWAVTLDSYRGTKYPEVPCDRCGFKIAIRPDRKGKLCLDCKQVARDLGELESWL